MTQRVSPNRRRSIAVLNQGATRPNNHRRRAYSIAPGEKLSPAAKARRSLAPRKSILKASINLPPSETRQPEYNGASTGAPTPDDTITQSMDFTEVHSAMPRKSLNRRVSFASHAHVRLFEIQEQNTHSSAGSGSSPMQDSSPQEQSHYNDENSFPQSQRRVSNRPRFSVAFSENGERSMDLDDDDETVPLPAEFLKQFQHGSALEDDDFSDEDDDTEDMEITEAIRLNIERKRSLSLGPRASLPGRRRSSVATGPITSSQSQSENQIPSQHLPPASLYPSLPETEKNGAEQDENLTTQSVSFVSEGSDGDHTQPMEFTIPLSRSLRPPEPPSDAWLQLRAMTHAGTEPYEPPSPDVDEEDDGIVQPNANAGGDDELMDAMIRLQRARSSMEFPPSSDPVEDENEVQEDSFTSTDDSFGDDGPDQTVNMTQLMGTSLDNLDSTMDVTSVYGTSPERNNAADLPEPQSQTEEHRPAVFSVSPLVDRVSNLSIHKVSPVSALQPPESATVPTPFTFSAPRSPAPTKTAAPSTATSVPPKSPQPHRGTAAFAPPSTPRSAVKRPAPPLQAGTSTPSPAKKQAIGRLEPAKKAPFEPALSQNTTQNRRASTVRRPSGYFAQRKSLGGNVFEANAGTSSEGRANATAKSPKKVAGQGLGKGRARASLGTASMGIAPSVKFEHRKNSAPSQADSLYPDVDRIANENPPTPTLPITQAPHVVVVPSPTRSSSVPPSPRQEAPSLQASRRGLSVPPQSIRRSLSPAPVASGSATDHLVQQHGDDDLMHDSEQAMSTDSGIARQWRDAVDTEEMDDDEPPISIEQFFEMTGIRFMDELTMPKPRQSMVQSSHLRRRAPRRSSLAALPVNQETDSVPLAEFAAAMAIDVPRLELYTVVAADLTTWIEESKKICLEAEEEVQKVTPALFREFAQSDEAEKGILLHQLKLIKANNMAMAKSQWYSWKTGWIGELYGHATQGFSNLEADAEVLADIMKQTQEILPALRQEYVQIMAELEQEQADIAAIESSDQEYLGELKTTIAEQGAELEAFRADVSEARAKMERLQEKLDEIESQKQEATAAISSAQHALHIQKESTSSEVFRLKEELEALQDMHLWRSKKIGPDYAEFVYASHYQICIPCIKFNPIVEDTKIFRTKESRAKERDLFPHLTELTLQHARRILQGRTNMTLRMVLEHLGDFWSSCAQFRTQLAFIAIKYPLSVDVMSEPDGEEQLHATVTILFPGVKGKAFVSFILDMPTFSQWPLPISSLQADVKVAYGNIDRDTILNAVRTRLAQSTPLDNHGCLLDTCIEASEQYE